MISHQNDLSRANESIARANEKTFAYEELKKQAHEKDRLIEAQQAETNRLEGLRVKYLTEKQSLEESCIKKDQELQKHRQKRDTDVDNLLMRMMNNISQVDVKIDSKHKDASITSEVQYKQLKQKVEAISDLLLQ